MAIGRRLAPWNTHLPTVGGDPADSSRNLDWLRALQTAIDPYPTERAWLDFLGDEGEDRVRGALGERKYARLQTLKRRYDPDNLFHLNQNVIPSW